jgi:small conductance mechanosensitive channel
MLTEIASLPSHAMLVATESSDPAQGPLSKLLTAAIIIASVIAVLWAVNWFLLRRHREMGEGRRFARRIVMLVLVIVGVMLVLVFIPLPEEKKETRRSELVAVVGLIFTGAIALASTTFVANAMAGLMLRAVRSFRPGDFVRVGDHFGRVTERGLFHTEIQTEDRDLVTVPNLYLVSNPVRVIRHSGTIVSATVSLGYDVPHQEIKSLLLQAAENAGLAEPFVQIVELGDFSVHYRLAGFLAEVKQLLTARSQLRTLMLETLHKAGIEIVSPTVMNQRRLGEAERLIPPESALAAESAEEDKDEVPEELIFDKAEEAERIGQLQIDSEQIGAEILELEAGLKTADEEDRPRLEKEIEQRRKRAEEISKQLKGQEG